jgi:hypothetical protein
MRSKLRCYTLKKQTLYLSQDPLGGLHRLCCGPPQLYLLTLGFFLTRQTLQTVKLLIPRNDKHCCLQECPGSSLTKWQELPHTHCNCGPCGLRMGKVSLLFKGHAHLIYTWFPLLPAFLPINSFECFHIKMGTWEITDPVS